MTLSQRLQEPTREPFRRVHPVTPLLRSGVLLLAVSIYLVRGALEGDRAPWYVVVPGAVLAGLALGTVSWWFTRYRISAEELRIDSGVLVRRQRRVRIERIQAVEVEQPLLARLFGMAELRIEVAGGDGGKLAYLTLGQAETLRHTLLERAAQAPQQLPVQSMGGPAGEQAGQPTRPPTIRPDPPGLQPQGPALFRVDDARLLAATMLRSDVLGSALTALVGAVVAVSIGRAGGLAVLVPLVLATAGMAWKGFSTGFGTTLHLAPRGLRLRAGLLDVRTQTVPAGRVQGVVVVEPLVWRWLGWARVDVTVAGAGGSGDEERSSGVLVPVGERREVEALLPLVLDGADPGQVRLDHAPRRARWVDPLGAGVLGVGVGERLLVTRRGVLTRRTDVVPLAKPQSVHVAQGPLQRLLGMASMQVHLPPGPVAAQAAHRDAAAAWALATASSVAPLRSLPPGRYVRRGKARPAPISRP